MDALEATAIRETTLSAIRADGRVPVLIIGAGINGAGVFRELALQGVDCLLVERGDYGGATSAAPSRLIHGGLKYLETGEFGLVAESARERNLLLKNAPHYVKPLESVVPVYARWAGIVGAALRFLRIRKKGFERGALVIRLGLALYDWLGRHRRAMPRHRYYSRQQSLARMPDMRPDIVGTGCYYDARVTHAERLNLELVLDAVQMHPGRARALNHAEVVANSGAGIVVRDHESGAQFEIYPEIVINAAGPWIDASNARLGMASHYIGGHKGAHLVLDHPGLHAALNGRMVYFGASDGRIRLVYPFFDRVLVGSTDIPVDDADAAVCEDSEVAYMLGEVRRLFPDLSIRATDIIYRYAGVRPLPAVAAADPGAVPRSHSMPVAEGGGQRPFPVLSMVGSKWTTFRSFAAEVTDAVLARLGKPRVASSETLAIGGGRDYPQHETEIRRWTANLAFRFGLTDDDARCLFDRYGTRAVLAARHIADDQCVRLSTLNDYFRGEILFLCRKEQVCRLADIVLRRTPLGLLGRLDRAVLEELAGVAAGELGWDDERRACEIERVVDMMKTHGVAIAIDKTRHGLDSPPASDQAPRNRRGLCWAYDQPTLDLAAIGPRAETIGPAGVDELVVRVEAATICSSDIKLIKPGGNHPLLADGGPSDNPQRVLGHELCLRVEDVGAHLAPRFQVGQRLGLQPTLRTDDRYTSRTIGRDLPGGFTQYMRLDQRIVGGDEPYVFAVPEHLPSAVIAMLEPYACVERAYRANARTSFAKQGKALIYIGDDADTLYCSCVLMHESVTFVGGADNAADRFKCSRAWRTHCNSLAEVENSPFDDIVICGEAPAADITQLLRLLAQGGMLVHARKSKTPLEIAFDPARIHYHALSFFGTSDDDVASALAPNRQRYEVVPNGTALVFGAGGPMGRIHVHRLLQLANGPRTVIATSRKEHRRKQIMADFARLAAETGRTLRVADGSDLDTIAAEHAPDGFSDVIVAAPSARAVDEDARQLADDGLLVVFAGTPFGASARVDFGKISSANLRITGSTSCSVADQQDVLARIVRGELHPAINLKAVVGLGALGDALAAMMAGDLAGKIAVYPQLPGLPLTTIDTLIESERLWNSADEAGLARRWSVATSMPANRRNSLA
jgi:glycerol-3-phosphate dehydrogenase